MADASPSLMFTFFIGTKRALFYYNDFLLLLTVKNTGTVFEDCFIHLLPKRELFSPFKGTSSLSAASASATTNYGLQLRKHGSKFRIPTINDTACRNDDRSSNHDDGHGHDKDDAGPKDCDIDIDFGCGCGFDFDCRGDDETNCSNDNGNNKPEQNSTTAPATTNSS